MSYSDNDNFFGDSRTTISYGKRLRASWALRIPAPLPETRAARSTVRYRSATAEFVALGAIMARDLDALLKQVCDESSFLELVQALAEDFQEERELEENKPGSPIPEVRLAGKNGSIDSMLRAAAAWGRSTSMNPTNNTAVQNPWYAHTFCMLANSMNNPALTPAVSNQRKRHESS